jgi:hypothetical protein
MMRELSVCDEWEGKKWKMESGIFCNIKRLIFRNGGSII